MLLLAVLVFTTKLSVIASYFCYLKLYNSFKVFFVHKTVIKEV